MKTVIINASPRKNQNTAKILTAVKDGALSVGAKAVYFDLYDLKYTGCRSCLACKRKGVKEPWRCYFKDELTPVLEEIYTADNLVLGSPVYYGEPTGMLRSLLERLVFPAMTYNDYTSVFNGKVNTFAFLTMNAPKAYYEQAYKPKMEEYFAPFRFLKGKIEIIPVCDTLQVNDYSKYEMANFSEEHKKAVYEKDFPAELEKARKIGENINK